MVFWSPSPGDRAHLSAAVADGAPRGKVSLFGRALSPSLSATDWQRDPFSSLTWPSVHHSKIDVLELGGPSDARVVWELNRCQHLIPLAQAYVHSCDDRYARACFDQIESWIAQNPTSTGINWTSTMEVAIRGVVWSWLLAMLEGAPSLTVQRRTAISRCLWSHGLHIYRHLEHEEHSGNHYLANALGLIALGIAFHPAREAGQWLQRGQAILDEEILRQFYPDGVNYEGSLAYHGLALEIALLGYILLERVQLSLSETSLERLERALDVSLAITREDGTYPAVGDVDDGHILPLGTRTPRSQMHLLALGAVLFNRADCAVAAQASAQEVLWLLGPAARVRLDSLRQQAAVEPESHGFKQGGVYVMRSGTQHLTLDCGNIGSLGRGGHGHADLLSFECFALGQPLIVDGGTFCYTANSEARHRYRGTAQHNTLMVDGQETLQPAGLWAFQEPAQPRVHHWSVTDISDIFSGEYELPGRGIAHQRSIVFDKARGAWLIADHVRGTGRHLMELRFHVPTTKVELLDAGARIEYSTGMKLLILRVEAEWAEVSSEPSAISSMYLQESPALAIILGGSGTLPARCLTAIVPYEGQCPDRASILEWARTWAHELQPVP
ncbi:MAG: alginate lyase family protein [Chloroflexota bacterium]